MFNNNNNKKQKKTHTKYFLYFFYISYLLAVKYNFLNPLHLVTNSTIQSVDDLIPELK